MRAMSSAAPRNSMMVTASEINSDAIGPMICTPRTSSVLASAITLAKPVVSPSAARAAVGHERNEPAFVLAAFGLELLLGLAHPGDFRRGVDHPRHGGEVDVSVLAGNALGHRDALFFGLVRQHRAAHHVAHRPHVGQVGLAVFVDGDEAALVQLQAHGFGIEAAGVRHAADGDDQLVHHQLLVGALWRRRTAR